MSDASDARATRELRELIALAVEEGITRTRQVSSAFLVDDKIDTVAQAIFCADSPKGYPDTYPTASWWALDDSAKARYRRLAEAAIEAM
jgi:hypothetical protein